jgi:hypothetical protein
LLCYQEGLYNTYYAVTLSMNKLMIIPEYSEDGYKEIIVPLIEECSITNRVLTKSVFYTLPEDYKNEKFHVYWEEVKGKKYYLQYAKYVKLFKPLY